VDYFITGKIAYAEDQETLKREREREREREWEWEREMEKEKDREKESTNANTSNCSGSKICESAVRFSHHPPIGSSAQMHIEQITPIRVTRNESDGGSGSSRFGIINTSGSIGVDSAENTEKRFKSCTDGGGGAVSAQSRTPSRSSSSSEVTSNSDGRDGGHSSGSYESPPQSPFFKAPASTASGDDDADAADDDDDHDDHDDHDDYNDNDEDEDDDDDDDDDMTDNLPLPPSTPGTMLLHDARRKEREALQKMSEADAKTIRQLSQQVRNLNDEIKALRHAGTSGRSHHGGGEISHINSIADAMNAAALNQAKRTISELEEENKLLKAQLAARTRQLNEQQQAFSGMMDSAERLVLLESDENSALEQELRAATLVNENIEQQRKESASLVVQLTKRIEYLERQIISREAGAISQALSVLADSHAGNSPRRAIEDKASVHTATGTGLDTENDVCNGESKPFLPFPRRESDTPLLARLTRENLESHTTAQVYDANAGVWGYAVDQQIAVVGGNDDFPSSGMYMYMLVLRRVHMYACLFVCRIYIVH